MEEGLSILVATLGNPKKKKSPNLKLQGEINTNPNPRREVVEFEKLWTRSMKLVILIIHVGSSLLLELGLSFFIFKFF